MGPVLLVDSRSMVKWLMTDKVGYSPRDGCFYGCFCDFGFSKFVSSFVSTKCWGVCHLSSSICALPPTTTFGGNSGVLSKIWGKGFEIWGTVGQGIEVWGTQLKEPIIL